jgi:2-polyprenyl-3-methyl-5-hydroxy-6-metoxy-1,4-benzoquinol methylase
MDYLKIEVSSDHPLCSAASIALIEQIWARFSLPLGSATTALDIGPGKGLYSKWLRSHNCRVSCLDIDSSLEEYYRNLGCTFKTADLRKEPLPFDENHFDLIWCSHVIEHLREPLDFLEECKRVLKPGGYLILRTPDIQKFKFSFWGDPTHVSPFTQTSLAKILVLAGFEVTECTSCDLYPLRGLHRIRAYQWAPWLLWKGVNLLGIGKKQAN